MSSTISLKSIFDTNKLIGPNFWIGTRCENCSEARKEVICSWNPIPNAPVADIKEKVRNEHQRHVDDDEHATYVTLTSMSPELQRQYENIDAYDMIMHLKELFDEASRTKRYEISKELFRCKMIEGSLVNTHVLKMINYIEKLSQLGFVMDNELSIDLVLQPLP